MMENNIFDTSYVGTQPTAPIREEKSTMKDFLKNPIKQDDINKYGTSKPQRITISAVIEHGKS